MLETPATPHNEDLDKEDRQDKWRYLIWVLVLLLIGSVTWILIVQSKDAKIQASSEASQKFTLAQQVAAACAIKEQADDLGGLCSSATQIVKAGPTGNIGAQGPPGDVGIQGPLGPKGEPGNTVTGPKGEPGNTVIGPKGDPGNSIIGPQGLQGLIGKGINGDTGSVGPQGEPGLGTPGIPGKDGINGINGLLGAPGISGTNGVNGAPGIQGPPAFPFSFTFTVSGKTFNCDITSSSALATCTIAP